VDYPFFACDARGQYDEAIRQSRSNQNQEDDSELIATYKQPCQDPRSKVSIPERQINKEMSLLDSVINAITSPSFGFELLQVKFPLWHKQSTRLLNDRCYARPEPFFFSDNIDVPPSLHDLSPPTARPMHASIVDIFIHRLLHWQFCSHLPFSVSHSLPIFFHYGT
jgi:hypothetical protein